MDETTNTIEAALNRIRQFRLSMDWSRNKLATESGVPEGSLRTMDTPDWNPTVATIRKLEELIARHGADEREAA